LLFTTIILFLEYLLMRSQHLKVAKIGKPNQFGSRSVGLIEVRNPMSTGFNSAISNFVLPRHTAIPTSERFYAIPAIA
jgi:hypothetical protein